LNLFSVHLQELEIVGSCNDEDRIEEALACLCDPALALHQIVTHSIPFERWPEAFALARQGHDRALKVAITFPEAP
jgi:threonine dehydrogenase-like Zn-dependent dehydrogenase